MMEEFSMYRPSEMPDIRQSVFTFGSPEQEVTP